MHGLDQQVSATQPGGNMEGKEVRFGIADSALFATITTDASCGAVNGVHDSFTPLGGMIPLINMMLGEVVFGGVGAGLYGIVVFVILTVFIAGLMVGRTPEYLGKKIEAYDVKMAMLTVLIFSLLILSFTAVGSVTADGKAGITNPGPHGLSQILYAYTSGAANNGSAFAGLERKYALVQRDDRVRHAAGTIFHGASGAGDCRKPGEEEDRAGICWHVSGDDAALRDAPCFRDLDRQRAHFLSGAEPGADSRAPAAACRESIRRIGDECGDDDDF